MLSNACNDKCHAGALGLFGVAFSFSFGPDNEGRCQLTVGSKATGTELVWVNLPDEPGVQTLHRFVQETIQSSLPLENQSNTNFEAHAAFIFGAPGVADWLRHNGFDPLPKELQGQELVDGILQRYKEGDFPAWCLEMIHPAPSLPRTHVLVQGNGIEEVSLEVRKLLCLSLSISYLLLLEPCLVIAKGPTSQ